MSEALAPGLVSLDRSQVQALIPHRPPFLFVESAELRDGRAVRGICQWPRDNPLLQGHFPAVQIVPGVLLVEAAAQLAAVLLASRARPAAHPQIGMLTGIRRASFHRPVLPEEAVDFSVELGQSMDGMAWLSAEGQDEAGRRVCQCEIRVALATPPPRT